MYKCDQCNKEFKEKFTLNRHQRETKQCSKKMTEFICEFCNKKLSSKQRVGTHLNICKKKTDNKELQSMKKEMSILKESIEKMKSQGNTTNNITINTNIMNNYMPFLQYMTPSVIKETFEQNYTIKDLSGSQKALADFTSKHFLSGKNKAVYLCTDRSRQHFIFPDEKKDNEDQNAMILIALISKGFGAVKKLYKKQLTELDIKLKKYQEKDNTIMISETFIEIKKLKHNYQEILSTQDEGDDYRSQLSKILPSNVENRMLIDTTLERLEDDDSDVDEEQIVSTMIKVPVLYDKTARNIGGITYGKLRMYKNHYQETGIIKIPEYYTVNEEYKQKFLEFLYSDE